MTTDIGGDARLQRLTRLYATDGQLQAARPSPAVVEAINRPGLRLIDVLGTFVDSYADRPALGTRATAVVAWSPRPGSSSPPPWRR
jgi:fatty acid CoA ligase FadD9